MSFIPGANVGPYRIVEQAERSGVATTYTAYQPSLGRYVTLVVVPAIDGDDSALLRQYQRQLELVLSLRHPNILTVIDHGEHLGVPFVVTETMEAEPLSDRLGAPWPLAEVVRVLRPIAAALDYAHGLGVVHGDVRPSSVLLTPDGTPILAGFGLMTRPLAAPRRRAGADRRLEDVALAQPADRRGLALIAYEMLTGRTTDVDTADFERPLLPAQIGSPLLAAPVERVLLRELTGEANDRYPSATAFVDDLSSPVETTRTNGVAPSAPVAEPPTARHTAGRSRQSRRGFSPPADYRRPDLRGAGAARARSRSCCGAAMPPDRSPRRPHPGTEATAPATSAAGWLARRPRARSRGPPPRRAATGAGAAGAASRRPRPLGAAAAGSGAAAQAQARRASRPPLRRPPRAARPSRRPPRRHRRPARRRPRRPRRAPRRPAARRPGPGRRSR